MRLNNSVILIGRLTADPELKTTNTGLEVTTFSIAVDRPKRKDSEDKETDFINCVAWRKTAAFICQYFKKGKMIQIGGSLQSRKYEDANGNKRTAYEVVISDAAFVGPKQDGDQSNPAPIAPASPDVVADDDLPF